MTNELAPCYDERRKNCLMNLNNRCNGLKDTNFKHEPCPFFKDRREMNILELMAYSQGVKNGFVQFSEKMQEVELL